MVLKINNTFVAHFMTLKDGIKSFLDILFTFAEKGPESFYET